MDDQTTPFLDAAKPILAGDPALSDEHRADLWDTFHNSKNPDDLIAKLQPLAVPDDTKHRLVLAKRKSMPAVPPIDKATEAIKRVAQIDPQTLEVAETHPNVLKTLAGAATAAEKTAAEPTGESKGENKGKTPAGSKKTASLAPDVPATPSGHVLVRASDGGLHHIPTANVTRARQIDPDLQVLHVEP